MAISAVTYVVSSVATSYVADAAAIAMLDAGLAIGSEVLVGNVIGGAVGLMAGGLAGAAVRSAFTSPPGSVTQQAAQGSLINSSSNVAALPVIYGTRRVGGTRVLLESSGQSNEYLNIVLALGEGEIDAIAQIYLDDVAITDAKYSGLVYSESYTGKDSQVASAFLISALPSIWTNAHTGSGVAYVYLRLKYDGNVFRGLPTITVDLRGKKIYDPRTGLTAYGNNPVLCIRDYLTNGRYGRGINASLIDDASFIVAANHCDELVSVPGGTQARYTCDGIVDVNSTLFDSIKSMLSSCRGMLVYSGGKYKLVIDKLTSPTFGFTENNITGNWTITQPSRRNKYNRVTGGFFNGSSNWQQDLAISDSSAYRIQDNGLLLESKIDLPFTSNLYRAQQISGLVLKQSRFGISVKFSALQEGLRTEVGDVVSITHSTPGWVAKPFRVIQIDLKDDDDVNIVAIEYDDTVYNLDTLAAVTSAPHISLPDPMIVQVPGTPSATESLYQTTGSAGVKSRVSVTFSGVDPFGVSQRLSWRPSGGVWATLPDQQQSSFTLDDVAPGVYEFRAATINALGAVSAWSVSLVKEILGLTAVPADVSGFAITKSAGFAMASWNLSTDLDVRIGGRMVVRHSAKTSGATWIDGVVLEEFNGDAVTGLLPLLTGTYMARFRDSSDNYSVNTATFLATDGLVTGFNTAASSIQDAGFAGAKSNVVLISPSLIQLTGVTLVDAMGLIDSLSLWDSVGGISASGTYDFDSVVDLVTVATRRVRSSLTALSFDTGDFVDSWLSMVDDRGSWDGTVVSDCDVTLYAATTNDNPSASPTWSDWTPFFVGDFTCRAFKFRLVLTSAHPSHNISVSALRVDVLTPA